MFLVGSAHTCPEATEKAWPAIVPAAELITGTLPVAREVTPEPGLVPATAADAYSQDRWMMGGWLLLSEGRQKKVPLNNQAEIFNLKKYSYHLTNKLLLEVNFLLKATRLNLLTAYVHVTIIFLLHLQ